MCERGCSLAGRALPLHGRGQGFESPHLHQSRKLYPYVHAGGVVIIAKGKHPFPSRTRSLSPSAPTILGGQPPGKIGRCHSTRLHRRVFLCPVVVDPQVARKKLIPIIWLILP